MSARRGCRAYPSTAMPSITEIADWIQTFALQHDALVYAAIFVIGFFEGPILGVVLGALIKLGYFHALLVFALLVSADLLGDVMWYCLGRYFGTSFVARFGKYVGLDQKTVTHVERLYHRYQTHILLISKLTNGLGLVVPLFITAGIVRIPFRSYISLNFVGELAWTAITMGSGYLFGHLYVEIDGILGKMTLVACAALLIAAFLGFKKYVRNRIDRSVEAKAH